MNNNFDYNKNLKYVIENKVDVSDIKEQNNVLDSKNYNKTFNSIEKNLNLLYEKTRILQDMMAYSTLFIKNEIDDSVAECKDLLKSIEENRDLIKDSAYINYNVKLQSIFDTYSDRNNSPIKGVEFYNGAITLNNNLIEDVKCNNVEISGESLNSNIMNTKEDIIQDKLYRTFYMFDRPQKKPVREKIILTFEQAKTINKINFITSNCKIDSIEFTDENNKVETMSNYNTNLLKKKNIKKIIINISCENYMISQINYNDIKDQDFWDIINNIKNDENLILDKKKYYYYLFGLDKIEIMFVTKSNKSCFISKEIKIDRLKNNEYIALDSSYSCEGGSIEFYIMDGTNEIPILPEDVDEIIHEKVFYKTPTRFIIDDINSIKVFKNGIPSKISLNEAISDPDESYTVSYKPKSCNSIDNLINEKVKLKAIMRTYDENYIPFIKSIQIKKYGGGALWIDNTKI